MSLERSFLGQLEGISDECLLLDDICDVFSASDHMIFKKPLIQDMQCIPVHRERFIENLFNQILPLLSGYFYTSLVFKYVSFKVQMLMQKKQRLHTSECIHSTEKLVQTSAGRDAKSNVVTESDFKKDVKELRKFLKSLLKQEVNRNSLVLWNQYARFEWLVGNDDECRRVLSAAIHMHSQDKVPLNSDTYQQTALLLLYRSYAVLTLGIADIELDIPSSRSSKSDASVSSTLNMLVCLVEGPSENSFPLSATKILKCQRLYRNRLDVQLQRFIEMSDEKLGDCRNYLSMTGDPLVHWVYCFSLFTYLTTGIKAACEVFNEIFQRLSACVTLHQSYDDYYSFTMDSSTSSGEQEEEMRADRTRKQSVRFYSYFVFRRLKEAHISLLRYHVDCCNAPLCTLREPLMQALQQFHSHRHFLESFIDLEVGSRIAGRLSKYFGGSLSSRRHHSAVPDDCLTRPNENDSSSLIHWTIDEKKLHTSLYALLSLFRRLRETSEQDPVQVKQTGVTHQLRAWFEKALQQRSVCHSVLIWRLYMYFENTFGSVEKVKAVYYRSLQNCPWAKALYIDAIQYVPDMMQDVLDLMIEKELRVRTPVEELDLLLSNYKQT